MLSRRDLLAGASAIAAASAFDLHALAKAPMQSGQAPAFYRFNIGAIEATVISDGPLGLGPAKEGVFSGVSTEQFTKIQNDNFLPADNVELEQNMLILNTGDRLVLFDTGMGTAKAFGPKTGKLLANLKAAGYEPKDFDAIIITHAHPDHCWGLMSDAGERIFPNAQIYMTEADFNFWTDESKGTDDMMKMIVSGTRKQLLPNKERMVFIKDGQELFSGVQAMATPGHTTGHMSFMIASQGKSLFNLADVAHHSIISLERPKAEFMFDGDKQQAVQTRLRILDMLASGKTQIVAYHFPFPGVGFVAKQGDGFRYVASPMQTVR
jgi:glyoxylase-like metal-dependent hydrolase (beta-lactamase superfamily II)